MGGRCEFGIWFQIEGGAVLGVGVACGHPAGKDEEEGEGEEFTKVSVE